MDDTVLKVLIDISANLILKISNAKAKSNPGMNYSKSLPLNRVGSGFNICI